MSPRWLTAASVALALSLAGCGSSEQSPGFTSTGDASADAGPVATDAGIVWPDADPYPDAAPGPHPGFEGGAQEAGAFTCSGKTGKPGERTISLQSGGLPRTSIVHVPDSYDPTHGSMLVLNFHGFSSAGWQEALLSRMSGAADQRGFIVAYPEGVATSWNAGDCCGTAWTDSVDDIAFTKALLDKLESDYCIDPKRVYATGMSNGGFFSHRVGCELADRFAAIAPVAGVLGLPASQCKPSRPLPIIDFHGTSDPLVPYDGGTPILPTLGAGLVFTSVADTMRFWQLNNGCSGDKKTIYQHGDATCVEWPDCQARATTVLCTIDGGGHTWPGGLPVPPLGKTSSDLDATSTMLDFFQAHPLP
jgi:polyhydroxybutyrate depolymerase